jgi:hypothetical protein
MFIEQEISQQQKGRREISRRPRAWVVAAGFASEPDDGQRHASQRDCETKQGPQIKECSFGVAFFLHE